MKRLILIFLAFISLESFAQQGLQMNFGEMDSTEMELQRQTEYYQFINGLNANNEFIGDLKLPDYKFNSYSGSPYVFKFNLQPLMNSFAGFGNYDIISPYFYNGEVLSSSATQINDRFTIGGFSYGANSIMSAPLPNQAGRSFDTYGSTMFMQYKVSKNFRIETRISVGQRQGGIPPPGF